MVKTYSEPGRFALTRTVIFVGFLVSGILSFDFAESVRHWRKALRRVSNIELIKRTI